MPDIIEFGDFDEFLDWQARNEAIANARVTPEQAEIGYGDHWARRFEDIVIFGRVMSLDELEQMERNLGCDEEEIASEREMISDSHERGYRFGYCYSVVEPEGELGSTHISVMTKITAEEFQAAKEHGWRI
jgi:hypothetical protein